MSESYETRLWRNMCTSTQKQLGEMIDERNEAIRRAEAAEVALADTETPTLDDLAEHEPWSVLRAAVRLLLPVEPYGRYINPFHISELADRWECERGETAKRDRLIARAKEVYSATMGHETALAAVVDAVLAEAVDHG